MGSYLDREELEDMAKWGQRSQNKQYVQYYFSCLFNLLGNCLSFLCLGCIFVSNLVHKVCFIHWDNLMEQLDRKKIIVDKVTNEPYLIRYYVFLKERHDFPFNIFIHRFIKSDPDDLHDHPWNYYTIILNGGYWEYCKSGGELTKKWREVGYYKYNKAEHMHRIELDPGSPPCWTLFVAGKKIKDWGFYKDDQWIKADDYINEIHENVSDDSIDSSSSSSDSENANEVANANSSNSNDDNTINSKKNDNDEIVGVCGT